MNLFDTPVMTMLKGAMMRQRPSLFQPHPLVTKNEQFRLQYLGYVACCVAVNRPPMALEKRGFLALAQALRLADHEAEEQLQERASLTEDDLVKGVALLEQESARWACLLDILWLHLLQGEVSEADRLARQAFGILLGIPEKTQTQLVSVLTAVEQRDTLTASQAVSRIPTTVELAPLLKDIIAQTPIYTPAIHTVDWRQAEQVYSVNIYGDSSYRDRPVWGLAVHPLEDYFIFSEKDHFHFVTLTTGKATKAIHVASGARYIEISPNGRWCILHSRKEFQEHASKDNSWIIEFTANNVNKSIVSPEPWYSGFNASSEWVRFGTSLRNIHTGEKVALSINPFRFMPDGKSFIAEDNNQHWGIYDLTGSIIQSLDFLPKTSRVANVSPDGEWVLVQHEDKIVHQYHLSTGKSRGVVLACGEGYSPDGHWIVGKISGGLQIWSASTGERGAVISSNGNGITAYDFTPDSTSLVVGDSKNNVSRWRAKG